MSVHKAITNHVNQQHQIIKTFLELDEKREVAIEKVLKKAKAGKDFTTKKINLITDEINELRKSGLTPERKYVLHEMVLDYVSKKK